MALALLAAADSSAQTRRGERPPPATQAPAQPAAPPIAAGQVPAAQAPVPVWIVESPKTEAQADAERQERDDRAALGDRLLMFAALLVAVGAFLVIAFALQAFYLGLGLRTMRQSAQLAERNTIAGQRAFVYLGSLAWSVAGDNVKVGPIWANAGTTPARNLRISTNWKASHGELPIDFPYTYVRIPERLFLGPHGKAELGSVLLPMRDIQAALEQRLQIYVWGRAAYEDVFENTKPHHFEFCHRLEVTGATPDKVAIAFTQHGFRNGCDEDGPRPTEA